MSTGFELIPLAIGGAFIGSRAIYRGVKGAFERAREQAAEHDQALSERRVTFATDMRDLALARQALEASGLAVTEEEGVLDLQVDGHAVQVQAGEDGALQLVAPLLMDEEAASQLAVDLDTEYRKLVQAQSYSRVLEHARDHGMAVAGEAVEDDGSITITLEV